MQGTLMDTHHDLNKIFSQGPVSLYTSVSKTLMPGSKRMSQDCHKRNCWLAANARILQDLETTTYQKHSRKVSSWRALKLGAPCQSSLRGHPIHGIELARSSRKGPWEDFSYINAEATENLAKRHLTWIVNIFRVFLGFTQSAKHCTCHENQTRGIPSTTPAARNHHVRNQKKNSP